MLWCCHCQRVCVTNNNFTAAPSLYIFYRIICICCSHRPIVGTWEREIDSCLNQLIDVARVGLCGVVCWIACLCGFSYNFGLFCSVWRVLVTSCHCSVVLLRLSILLLSCYDCCRLLTQNKLSDFVSCSFQGWSVQNESLPVNWLFFVLMNVNKHWIKCGTEQLRHMLTQLLLAHRC